MRPAVTDEPLDEVRDLVAPGVLEALQPLVCLDLDSTWPRQVLGPPGGDHTAAGKDDHAVADELDLAQEVGVEEDADLAAAQLLQHLADRPAARRVERARRLVEQERLRRADQRLGDAEPLLHPLRHRVDPDAGRVAEPDELEQPAAFRIPAGGPGQSLVEAEHLVGRVPAREAEELCEVAERRAGRRRSGRRAADLRPSAGGADQAAGDLDERRLAGAVRARGGPTSSPGCTSRLTPSSAWTRP